MALVDTRGFDFGPGVTSEARQFASLIGQGQLNQSRDLALGQQREQIQNQKSIMNILGSQGQAEPQTQQEQMLAEQSLGLGGEQALSEQPKVRSLEELKDLARNVSPKQAADIFKSLGIDSASQRAEMSRFASQLQNAPKDQVGAMINARAQSLQSQGRDPVNTLQLLDMTPEQMDTALTGVQLADLSTKDRLGFQQKQSIADGKKIATKDVKSSKILDDGTVIQVLKNGETVVLDPTGSIVEGKKRTKAIIDAQEFGVDIQQRRSKSRQLGTGTGKIALDAFDKVGNIRENILDLKEGIRLVKEEGAETGPIADRLPSFFSGTRKLDNLRRKLGLNVVGAVTFGALSEGELKLAMDVALPDGLSEEETVDWMQARINAQEKLANNLEEAALFLSKPGNTVREFILMNKAKAESAKKKADRPTPTGKTATNPTTGEKLQEMSDGTWSAL